MGEEERVEREVIRRKGRGRDGRERRELSEDVNCVGLNTDVSARRDSQKILHRIHHCELPAKPATHHDFAQSPYIKQS